MQNEFSAQVKTAHDGRVTVVELDGYLDAYTAPEFDTLLEQLFTSGQVRVVVDCGSLEYISSAGLGVFMGHIEQFRSSGGDIVLCALSPRISAIVEMLGFPHIFRIFPERSVALAVFDRQGTTH